MDLPEEEVAALEAEAEAAAAPDEPDPEVEEGALAAVLAAAAAAAGSEAVLTSTASIKWSTPLATGISARRILATMLTDLT